ncbi:MAG: helix-turn-helix domain-containing protein, partial [Planctomycetota bacterium]
MPPAPRQPDPAIRALTSLGFTDLEATIYAALVAGEGETGYALAKATGKPVANVYKAVESLEAKGAIVVAGLEPRTLRAVDPDDLIGALRKRFETKAEDAQRALTQLESADGSGGMYRLTSAQQVFERARTMIARAQATVLVDAYPTVLAEIAGDLVDATARGVKVVLLAYTDEHDTPGVRRMTHRFGDLIMERRIDDHLIVNTDAEQLLMAQLSVGAEHVMQAIWTDQLFLAMHYYDSFFCQFVVHTIDAHVERHGGPKSVQALIDGMMDVRLAKTPGFDRYFG